MPSDCSEDCNYSRTEVEKVRLTDKECELVEKALDKLEKDKMIQHEKRAKTIKKQIKELEMKRKEIENELKKLGKGGR